MKNVIALIIIFGVAATTTEVVNATEGSTSLALIMKMDAAIERILAKIARSAPAHLPSSSIKIQNNLRPSNSPSPLSLSTRTSKQESSLPAQKGLSRKRKTPEANEGESMLIESSNAVNRILETHEKARGIYQFKLRIAELRKLKNLRQQLEETAHSAPTSPSSSSSKILSNSRSSSSASPSSLSARTSKQESSLPAQKGLSRKRKTPEKP